LFFCTSYRKQFPHDRFAKILCRTCTRGPVVLVRRVLLQVSLLTRYPTKHNPERQRSKENQPEQMLPAFAVRAAYVSPTAWHSRSAFPINAQNEDKLRLCPSVIEHDLDFYLGHFRIPTVDQAGTAVVAPILARQTVRQAGCPSRPDFAGGFDFSQRVISARSPRSPTVTAVNTSA
jgi:hypothetical protein